ncbi:MAG: hypothetical protein Q9163_002196 [Psora crenata]
MGISEASHRGEQRKVKSPSTPSVEDEPTPILSSPQQSISCAPPIVAQKRRRSSSSAGTARKRQLLPVDPPPDIELPKTFKSKGNWHCPNCGFVCWRCYTWSKAAPPELPSLRHKDHSESEMSTSELQSSTPSGVTVPSNKKRKKCEQIGVKYVSPKDADFWARILRPCGVILKPLPPTNLKPIDIFGSQSLSLRSRVFIRKNEQELKEIIEDFGQYSYRCYDEHTLTTICHDSIVLRDRFISNVLSEDTQCVIASVRRDKWKPHKEGPQIPGHDYVYDWDIEPGTTYAVSINMFDLKHRMELSLEHWDRFVAERDAVCPYLTIEYKCLEKTGKQSSARYQTSAASVLWLHQQRQICDALGLPYDKLRHYSIAILDCTYTISEARYKANLYNIRQVASGNLNRLPDLKEYVQWSNAIHAWGLGPHASSFKEKAEQLIERHWATSHVPAAEPFPQKPSGS